MEKKKRKFIYILVSTLKYHTTTTIFLCFTVSLSLFMPSIRQCIKKCYQRVFVVISRRMRRRTLTILVGDLFLAVEFF
jgi:hypothetical protein